MKKTIEKFISLEKEMADEKGGFVLFGLFLREEAPNRWDVVISAPWFGENKNEPLNFIVKTFTSKLEEQELVILSRIVLLDPWEDFVKEVHGSVASVEHGNLELVNYVFNGMDMKRAHIITSKQNAT